MLKSSESMIPLTPDEVFALDPKIELTVCGTTKGEVFFRNIRPGSRIVAADSETFSALLVRTEYLTELNIRLEHLGKAEYTLNCSEDSYELIVTEGDVYLVTEWGRDTDIEVIARLSATMHEMLKRRTKLVTAQ